jgi:murein DD-endopeptidase MepM/ murein hydrolase activator NlpD
MKWTIFLLDRSSRRPIRFLAGKVALGLALLAFLAAAAGWGRMALIAARAVHQQYIVCKHRADSCMIHERIAFLEDQYATSRCKLKELSGFEKTLRLRYGLTAIPEEVRKAGVGGVPSAKERSAASSGGPLLKKAYDLEERMAAIARQAELEDSLLAESIRHVRTRHLQWAQTPSIKPAEGYCASRFGWRTDPMGGYDTRFHMGIDLANSRGTPVYASADGFVRFIGTLDGFGKVVKIRHEATCLETIYGHLDSFRVKEGKKVQRGDLIGMMGSTGRSTGPHLHYEVRDRGRSIDPQKFILPESLVVD